MSMELSSVQKSLVEELGGYKKLRPHFILTDSSLGYTHVYLHGNNHYCFLDDRVDYIIPERAFSIKEVIDALLEYRRQHNIFEVGDPVIRKWNNQLYWIISNIDNGSEFLIHKNKGARFKDCKVCELPCNLSHATDAEIEAGCQLESCQ